MPLMNPLGVRWGRSDSERLSPPPSFSSVHFFTSFHLFTSGCAHQWCTHSGVPTLVHPLWYTHSGAPTLVRPLWCAHSEAPTLVHPPVVHPLWRVIAPTLESHCIHWRVIVSIGESLSPLESHCLRWRVIVSTGESLSPLESHWLPPISTNCHLFSTTFSSPPAFNVTSPHSVRPRLPRDFRIMVSIKSIMDSMEIMKPRSNKSTGKSMCWKYWTLMRHPQRVCLCHSLTPLITLLS